MPGGFGAQLLQGMPRGFHLARHARPVFVQHRALLGQFQAAGGAPDQLGAERALQLLKVAADV
ncbi:hypothetical protein D3C73_1085360 [compost metagenome]